MPIRSSRALLVLAALSITACVEAGQPTGGRATATGGATVSGRVMQLRSDQQALSGAVNAQNGQLQSLRGSSGNSARAYNADVGMIISRLQVGTTPANPELVALWNSAQAHLDRITADLGQLNSLATQVTTQASVAGHLLDTVRSTYNVGGAVDEDHRQLRAIEGDTNRDMAQIDRLIADLNGEIARQNGFIAAERAKLAGLNYGVNVGRLTGGPSPGGPPRPMRR